MLLLGLAACGSLTETDDGVAFLDLIQPPTTTLEVGTTLQLQALALNARGEPVEAEVFWSSPDPFITVDESTGLVTAVSVGTGGRVQARTGTGARALYSAFLLLTVTDPPLTPAVDR